MTLNADIQDAMELLHDPQTGLGESTIRSYQQLDAITGVGGTLVQANTVITFPEADGQAGIQVGAEQLLIDGKPFETAGKDLGIGRWKAIAAGGSGVDIEVTGIVSGDTTVGYTIVINPDGSRTSA